jgi:para-nitrobenzyl esterase
MEGLQLTGSQGFLGIPFGQAPVGSLRFRPPQPALPWSGTLDATQHGASCPQDPEEPGMPYLPLSVGTVDEDCLNLNVWTPAADAGERPVLFWVHGGAFYAGSGSEPFYDGAALAAEQDVVVVTANYRLGVLGGFVHLNDHDERLSESANTGLLDVVLALEWVRDNIASFGGDPACVTLAGQSAGGKIVTTLLGMSQAEGLFQRAIVQSPGTPNPFTKEEAAVVTNAFLEHLDPSARADIAAADAGTLADAVRPVVQSMTMSPFGAPLGPSLDGSVLARPTLESLRDGASKDVPVLTGTTTHELHLMLKGVGLDSAGDEAVGAFAQLMPPPLGDRVAAAYSSAEIAGNGHPAAPQPLEFLMNDRMVRMNSVRLLEARAGAGAPTFSYLLQFDSPAGAGAAHCIENPLLFATTSVPDVPSLVGSGDHVEAMGRALRDRWAAFMRTGDPNAPGLPDWPAYDEDRRATYLLAVEPSVLDDPWSAQRAAWDGVDVPGAPVLL